MVKIVDSSESKFIEDVITPSEERLVIVDFWASWCAPCKSLTPILEEVVGEYGDRVYLVKIDVDKNQNLARQMQIRSLPSVYIFFRGQPVDGFMGLQQKPEIKKQLDKLLEQLGMADEDDKVLWERVEQYWQKGDVEGAASELAKVLKGNPDSVKAIVLLVHARLLLGERWSEVVGLLESVEVGDEDTESINSLRELDEESESLGLDNIDSEDEIYRKYVQSLIFIGNRDFDKGIEGLLWIISTDRDWREGRAKIVLIKLLKAMGDFDERVAKTRIRLSNLLFQ